MVLSRRRPDALGIHRRTTRTRGVDGQALVYTSGMATRALCVLTAALLAMGCGDSDAEEKPSLIGNWGVQLGDGCTEGLELAADRTYEKYLICDIEGGVLGVETEFGTYTATDKAVEFVPGVVSCTTNRNHERYGFAYVLEGDVLRVSAEMLPDTMGRLASDPRTGRGADVLYGCWEADQFHLGDLAPL